MEGLRAVISGATIIFRILGGTKAHLKEVLTNTFFQATAFTYHPSPKILHMLRIPSLLPKQHLGKTAVSRYKQKNKGEGATYSKGRN